MLNKIAVALSHILQTTSECPAALLYGLLVYVVESCKKPCLDFIFVVATLVGILHNSVLHIIFNKFAIEGGVSNNVVSEIV